MRYYSFNAAWSAHEQMASMRDGCGDEWWMVFHTDGWAALKGLGHESAAYSNGWEKLSQAIQQSFPIELSEFAYEPAFRWDATSFAYFILPGESAWTPAFEKTEYAGLDSGDGDLLQHVVGTADDYVDFAARYYECYIPLKTVKHIFDLKPITQEIVTSLNEQVSLADIQEELFQEISYPKK
jgi:hypothetical protein